MPIGVTPGWDDDFDAMIEYANAKGWSSADGTRVQAHVVRLEPVTLPAAWSANWRAAPEKTFLVDVDGTEYRGADLLDATARIAGRLHGAGLERGDRVLLSGDTSAQFVIAHCAALRLGLVVVPVNKAFSRREVDVIAGLARPRAAIVDEPAWRDWLPDDVVVTGVDVDLPDAAPPELDTAAADDVALLPFTSGTTGTPKGVLLSHGNVLAGADSVRRAWHWGPEDTLILSLPLFHMHGLGVGVHGSLLAGSTLLLQQGFDPERVLAACAEATMFFGVPTMYARLVDAPGVERLGSLRLCVSGSAPLERGAAPPCPRAHRPGRARAVRDDRDADARVEPLRRRTATGHGRPPPPGRRAATGRRVGRDPRARPERLQRLPRPAGGDGGGVHRRRVPPDRRHRRARRRRLPADRRPGQGAHHHRRVQRVSARGRGRPAG